MLLGNAHIEGTVGYLLHHHLQGGAARHGRGNAHDLPVLFGQLQERVAKYILETRRLWFVRFLHQELTGLAVKLAAWRMKDGLVKLCLRESLPFAGEDVK